MNLIQYIATSNDLFNEEYLSIQFQSFGDLSTEFDVIFLTTKLWLG